MTLAELQAVDFGRYIVLRNACKDPGYCPYCMRCRGLQRMRKVAKFYWMCRTCGAEHDERGTLTEEVTPVSFLKEIPMESKVLRSVDMTTNTLVFDDDSKVVVPGGSHVKLDGHTVGLDALQAGDRITLHNGEDGKTLAVVKALRAEEAPVPAEAVSDAPSDGDSDVVLADESETIPAEVSQPE